MADFTPGPWECRSIGVHAYTLTNLPKTARAGETDANARLIAAAPTLLALLERAVPLWEPWIEEDEEHEWLRQAREALAAARGEEGQCSA